MSDNDDDDFEGEEGEDEELDEDMLDNLPADSFSLSGLECLDDSRIFGAGFVRTRDKGNQLSVDYAIGENNISILSAPFERFDCDEGYYTAVNDDGDRVSTLILKNLKLISMELNNDLDDGEELRVYLVFEVESFEQKLIKNGK